MSGKNYSMINRSKLLFFKGCTIRHEIRDHLRSNCYYFLEGLKSVLGSQFQSRSMSTQRDEATIKVKFQPRERRFKTPYGHTAAMEWGKVEAPNKILCIHGWLDNAGSFECLIPFLLDHGENADLYHILSMDQPGLGFSSHKPPGTEYNQFSTIIEMRRIIRELNWDKVTLMGHSYGVHLSFMYSCIYPNEVSNMIAIDLAHPITREVNNWNIAVANSIDEYFKCEENFQDDPTTNIRVPVYSETDAIKRLMEGHSWSLTKESAEILLKRGAKKQRWGYTFTRDIRLRFFSLEMRPDDELMLKYLRGAFNPNLLVIRANRSPYPRPQALRMKYYQLFEKNCPTFRDVLLEGTHHLHMNTPETVAIEINKFLDEIRRGNTIKSNL